MSEYDTIFDYDLPDYEPHDLIYWIQVGLGCFMALVFLWMLIKSYISNDE